MKLNPFWAVAHMNTYDAGLTVKAYVTAMLLCFEVVACIIFATWEFDKLAGLALVLGTAMYLPNMSIVLARIVNTSAFPWLNPHWFIPACTDDTLYVHGMVISWLGVIMTVVICSAVVITLQVDWTVGRLLILSIGATYFPNIVAAIVAK